MAADALSRLHIRNLSLLKNEEEQDPAVIRMMERGEGDDDELMFNDTFAHSVETQTEFLQALYNPLTHLLIRIKMCSETNHGSKEHSGTSILCNL